MTDKLKVYIKGGNLENKGDEMMIKTVAHFLHSIDPSIDIAVPLHFAKYSERAKMGFLQTIWKPNRTRLSGLVGYPVLKKYRSAFGILLPKEVDYVIDISGYCYTDIFGEDFGIRNTSVLIDQMAYQKKFGTKFFLLPQAYGPFTNEITISNVRAILSNVDLLYVRDNISLTYLNELSSTGLKIGTTPDLTTLSPSVVPGWCKRFGKYVCIVPNSRILEQKGELIWEDYLTYLSRVCDILTRYHIKALWVFFHNADQAVIDIVNRRTKTSCYVSYEKDPFKLKGIISQSLGLVGSRYHSIVSALSQGIPSIGTSWSHKYEELFNSYDQPDSIENNFATDDSAIEKRLSIFLDQDLNTAVKKKIEEKAAKQKDQSLIMWQGIAHQIDKSYSVSHNSFDLKSDSYPELITNDN